MSRTAISAALLTFILALGSVAFAAPGGGLLASGSFRIYTPDSGGGGWVINKIPLKGDMLWGCKDVASVERCTVVPFGDFVPARQLEFIHVDKRSQAGWLKVTTPGFGDSIYACYNPEGEARCDRVKMEGLPPANKLKRLWPKYAPRAGGGSSSAPKSGRPLAGLPGGGGGSRGLSPSRVLEDASKGNMWLSAAIPVPGPINLYACRNLNTEAKCQLAVPDIYLVMREDLGFSKTSAKMNSKGKVVGVLVEEVSPGSAAARAKVKPGMVIETVGTFPVRSVAHMNGLLSQWPATYSVDLGLRGDEVITLDIKRGSGSSKKKK